MVVGAALHRWFEVERNPQKAKEEVLTFRLREKQSEHEIFLKTKTSDKEAIFRKE